jgi:hypothetical protein
MDISHTCRRPSLIQESKDWIAMANGNPNPKLSDMHT